MSDLIAEILEGFESESKYCGNQAYDDLLTDTINKIRQLIGRELLKDMKYTGINYGFCVTEEDIIEVCKLGEDNE